MASFSRITHPDTLQNLFRNGLRNTEFKVLPCFPNSQISIEHLWDVLDQQIQSILMSWCQTPQDTFKGLVASMPRQIRAGLAAQGGLYYISQVVLMLWLISVYLYSVYPLHLQNGFHLLYGLDQLTEVTQIILSVTIAAYCCKVIPCCTPRSHVVSNAHFISVDAGEQCQ